jgi:hypothetical protein
MSDTRYIIYNGKELTDYIVHKHSTKFIVIKDTKNNKKDLIYRDFPCSPIKVVVDGEEVLVYGSIKM